MTYAVSIILLVNASKERQSLSQARENMIISQRPLHLAIESASNLLDPSPHPLVNACHVLVLRVGDIKGPVVKSHLLGEKAGVVREEPLLGVVEILDPDHVVECVGE